jgi:hypothetical protein
MLLIHNAAHASWFSTAYLFITETIASLLDTLISVGTTNAGPDKHELYLPVTEELFL